MPVATQTAIESWLNDMKERKNHHNTFELGQHKKRHGGISWMHFETDCIRICGKVLSEAFR